MRLALSSPIYQFSHNISHVAAPEWLIHAHSFYEFYYIVFLFRRQGEDVGEILRQTGFCVKTTHFWGRNTCLHFL